MRDVAEREWLVRATNVFLERAGLAGRQVQQGAQGVLQRAQGSQGTAGVHVPPRMAAVGLGCEPVRAQVVQVAVVFEAASAEKCGQPDRVWEVRRVL